jgi:hypothetical protein
MIETDFALFGWTILLLLRYSVVREYWLRGRPIVCPISRHV